MHYQFSFGQVIPRHAVTNATISAGVVQDWLQQRKKVVQKMFTRSISLVTGGSALGENTQVVPSKDINAAAEAEDVANPLAQIEDGGLPRFSDSSDQSGFSLSSADMNGASPLTSNNDDSISLNSSFLRAPSDLLTDFDNVSSPNVLEDTTISMMRRRRPRLVETEDASSPSPPIDPADYLHETTYEIRRPPPRAAANDTTAPSTNTDATTSSPDGPNADSSSAPAATENDTIASSARSSSLSTNANTLTRADGASAQPRNVRDFQELFSENFFARGFGEAADAETTREVEDAQQGVDDASMARQEGQAQELHRETNNAPSDEPAVRSGRRGRRVILDSAPIARRTSSTPPLGPVSAVEEPSSTLSAIRTEPSSSAPESYEVQPGAPSDQVNSTEEAPDSRFSDWRNESWNTPEVSENTARAIRSIMESIERGEREREERERIDREHRTILTELLRATDHVVVPSRRSPPPRQENETGPLLRQVVELQARNRAEQERNALAAQARQETSTAPREQVQTSAAQVKSCGKPSCTACTPANAVALSDHYSVCSICTDTMAAGDEVLSLWVNIVYCEFDSFQ